MDTAMDISNYSVNEIQHYVVPYLTSHQVQSAEILHMEHYQHGLVAPHSHRHDLLFVVLEGMVSNELYLPDDSGPEYLVRTIKYEGRPGMYSVDNEEARRRFRVARYNFNAGDRFTMLSTDIHSIYFGKDAKLLRVSGRELVATSLQLIPVNDRAAPVDISAVQPWMFT
jgi:hypothetical protein